MADFLWCESLEGESHILFGSVDLDAKPSISNPEVTYLNSTPKDFSTTYSGAHI